MTRRAFLCFERQTLGRPTAPLPKRNVNAHSVKDSALLSTISVPCVIALRSRLVCHLTQRFGGYAVNVIVPVIQFCIANEKRKMNGHIPLFIFSFAMQNGINVVHYIIIVILTSTHINSYMSEIIDIVRLKNCLYINMIIVEFSIAPRYSIPRE